MTLMYTGALKRAALLRFSSGAVILGALFFGTAGTFRYWEAWAFLAILFLPMMAVVVHFLRHDPELLERRLRAKEERSQQRWIQALSSLVWMVVFVLPGLDRRFGWSDVPLPLVVLALLLVLAGYLFFALVLRENSYAGRTIRVEEGQTVIDTGPYALVRHPMYLGVGVMILFSPLALGSWWALIPALFLPIFLVARIRDEEEALLEELPGYEAYTRKVGYRVIPGVW